MDRSAPKPGHVRSEPPEAPLEVEPLVETPPTPPVASRSWRLAILVWVTVFAFLAAYELITLTLRVLRIR
jgi:hypothetical protein